jgi:hypothetical protein
MFIRREGKSCRNKSQEKFESEVATILNAGTIVRGPINGLHQCCGERLKKIGEKNSIF